MVESYPNIPVKEQRAAFLRFMAIPEVFIFALFALLPRLVDGSFTRSPLPGLPWWLFYIVTFVPLVLGLVYVVLVIPSVMAKTLSGTIEVGEDHFVIERDPTGSAGGSPRRGRVEVSYARVERLSRASMFAAPIVTWKAAPAGSDLTGDAAGAGGNILTVENEERLRRAYDQWLGANTVTRSLPQH